MRPAVVIPFLLVWFRLVLAPGFWIGYWLAADQRLYVGLLLAGIISDIFDGVLARRWKTSTPRLRRWDGNVDTLFYGCAGTVCVLLHAVSLQPWRIPLLVMFLFLLAQNGVALFRYGRNQPSYHMWSGKLWSISLVVALIGLFLDHPSAWTLGAVVALGLYNSIEGIIASLISPKPLVDIPTVFHVIRLARSDVHKPLN
jgi:phosphatidylglycerophosphate synthase